MARIVLLGGAPAIGKSSAAQHVASQLGIPCISTDTIRRDLRRSLSREQSPGLFLLDKSTIGDPVDYLDRTSVQRIISDVDQECREVWKGVVDRIRGAQTTSLVIEGVAIIPEEASHFVNKYLHVRAAILVNSDASRITSVIAERGVGGPPHLFPDRIKRKQFEWVRLSNDRYRLAAEHCGLPTIDLADENHIEKILDAVS